MPPLCIKLSKMAHALVGKVVSLQLQGHGFNPQWVQLLGP